MTSLTESDFLRATWYACRAPHEFGFDPAVPRGWPGTARSAVPRARPLHGCRPAPLVQRIADGEKARTDAGGPPIAWPSAAEVAAVRAQFSTQAAAQSSAKDATDREQGDVERLLPEVAAAVKDLWDTIEFHLRHEPTPASLRRRAREWGLTYATRPGETADEGAAPTNPTQPRPRIRRNLEGDFRLVLARPFLASGVSHTFTFC